MPGRPKSKKEGKKVDEENNFFWLIFEWFQHALYNYFPVSFPLKLLMTTAASLLLSGFISDDPEVQMEEKDVFAYVFIYCFWAICFLTDIMLHLNAYYLGKVLSLLLRLFAAEIVVSCYLYLKGDRDILKRGLNIYPLVGPCCEWMAELVHSVRFILVIGCSSASLVAHLFDRPEIADYEAEDDRANPRNDS